MINEIHFAGENKSKNVSDSNKCWADVTVISEKVMNNELEKHLLRSTSTSIEYSLKRDSSIIKNENLLVKLPVW